MPLSNGARVATRIKSSSRGSGFKSAGESIAMASDGASTEGELVDG